MKRKRLEMEYTLVDEYLTQREADFYNKLKKLNKIKEPPKKPLLKKINSKVVPTPIVVRHP